MNQTSVLDLSTDESTLVLSTWYSASPERVFGAWLDPEAMKKWIKPSPECVLEILRFEAQVGGEFAARMILDEGTFGYSGRFHAIDPHHYIEMSWQWDPSDEDPYPETLLTIELQPQNGGTQLVLTHKRLRSLESRDAHSEGWTNTLTTLFTYLETQ